MAQIIETSFYIIANTDGYVVHRTLAPNRAESWRRFGNIAKPLAKKMGYRCVKAVVLTEDVNLKGTNHAQSKKTSPRR